MIKEIIYLEEMPKDLMIETKDMLIIGTGEKYTPKEVRQHERVLSTTKL